MILDLVLGLCWLAALHRVYLAVRSPRLWRVAFAVAVTALAIALTVDTHGGWLTELFPHLDKLIDHWAAVVAASAGLIYIHTLHHQQPPRAVIVRSVASGAIASTVLVVTWALAPPLDRHADFGATADTEPLVALHYLVFYLYVAYGAAVAATYCGRRLLPRHRPDTARVVSLALIGGGTALASCALLLGAASVLTDASSSARLQGIKDVLVPLSAAVMAAGVLLLVVLSPALVELVQLHRRWLRLRSLWRGLTAIHPEVALHVRPSWPLRQALRIREQRALVEIHDALARERVPSEVRTLEALGHTLRRRERGPVPATSVLPPSGDFDADLATLLQLAAAYDAAAR